MTADPTLTENAAMIANDARSLADQAASLAIQASQSMAQTGGAHDGFLVTGLTVFVLACFVGYYVVWSVTPALHTPLMSVTNAVSSVIVVGALIAAAGGGSGQSKWLGLIAVALASVNIFGGFAVTQRMLSMYKKKERRDA